MWRLTPPHDGDVIASLRRLWDTNYKGFPGTLCVSLERRHMDALKAFPYFAAEKTDGERYLLYIMRYEGENLVLLINRLCEVFILSMMYVPRKLYDGTIMDGELILNQQTDNYDYLVFDAVVVAGSYVGKRHFSQRMGVLQEAMYHYRFHTDHDTLHVRMKVFLPCQDMRALVEHVDRMRDVYATDGIIFVPENIPVIPGRNFKMFKWKDAAMHTVDFMIAPNNELRVYGGHGQCVGVAHLVEEDLAVVDLLPMYTIVECKVVDACLGRWKLLKVRHDKSHPNDQMTYERTLLSIQDAITLKELEAVLK